jgi:drug/metabolite transporter (DMT)-like permease
VHPAPPPDVALGEQAAGGGAPSSYALPMTSVALALVAAVAWGAGDFLGGRASKLVSSTVVVWTSGVMSIVVIGAGALLLGGADPGTALAWGLAGGVAVGLGGLVLYKGLAEGRMSVVAPTAGVVGAALPVAVDVVRGERFGATIWVGIALALVAIWLLTTGGSEAGRGGVRMGVLAGVGFGLVFVFIDFAPDASGLWPVVGTKLGSVAITSSLLLVARPAISAARAHWVPIAGLAVFDALATIAYLEASRAGSLAVAAVIASFYPAPTVALAAIVLRERLAPTHWLGAGLALVAVTLISL